MKALTSWNWTEFLKSNLVENRAKNDAICSKRNSYDVINQSFVIWIQPINHTSLGVQEACYNCMVFLLKLHPGAWFSNRDAAECQYGNSIGSISPHCMMECNVDACTLWRVCINRNATCFFQNATAHNSEATQINWMEEWNNHSIRV